MAEIEDRRKHERKEKKEAAEGESSAPNHSTRKLVSRLKARRPYPKRHPWKTEAGQPGNQQTAFSIANRKCPNEKNELNVYGNYGEGGPPEEVSRLLARQNHHVPNP